MMRGSEDMAETIAMDKSRAAISKSRKAFFSIQINKQKGLLLAYSLFVLFALFEPDYILLETSFHTVFRIAKYVSALLVVSFFLIRKTKPNIFLLETILFEGLLLFSTIINGSAIEKWISDCGYVIVLVLFAQTLMETDTRIFPLALSIVLGLYTHINSICRLLYPSGMYINSLDYWNCWFLGYDNNAGTIILIAIMAALFRILYYKNRLLLWDWSVLVSGCWFILIQNVATGLVAGVLFFAFVLASKNRWFRQWFSRGFLIVVGMILMFFLIQFVSIQEKSIFSFAFDALSKSTTFTGRTRIWKVAWRDIQNSGLLIGRGLQTSAMNTNHFGLRWAVHLHSYYLQVIYEGGIFAFIAFLGVLMHTVVRFDKGKFNATYMPFIAGLLAVMLMWQMEAYGDLVRYGFVILSLIYNAPLLRQSEKTAAVARIRFVFRSSVGRKYLS